MDGQKIIATIARIARKRLEDVQGHLSLTTLGLTSSFGVSALRSMLEAEAKVRLPPLTSKMSVDEVIALLGSGAAKTASSGNAPAAVRPTARLVAPVTVRPTGLNPMRYDPPANLGMGMDIQEIASLPETTDLRSHEFYSTHFSPEELATAVLRPDPRAHLCGIFCAKEAAKKSHSELLNLRMDEMVVSHDANGRPLLRVSEAAIPAGRFQFILSITHSSQVAAATCLSIREVN